MSLEQNEIVPLFISINCDCQELASRCIKLCLRISLSNEHNSIVNSGGGVTEELVSVADYPVCVNVYLKLVTNQYLHNRILFQCYH